ncbi:dynamin family protein [Spirulina sp. CS-785/01]|uniref:dynamin family protein n=1 Tax=Spirulina sp. CS-785/01 TaxID=3021716 RepID=UPI00232C82A8|nr:dynamin family protein [Spirulina sp. CS-785/01]MDB9313772.1 dynamin family protein [Spirulina sp. CS-785/01]
MAHANVTELLDSVRQLLNELGEGMVHLANAHPDVFDDPELKSQVEAFREAYQDAKERLDNPTLSIATLGTTSSGKSTIVNALIGRRIAPIEAGEMSGGVLRLRVSDHSRLVVKGSENANWETGEWSGLSDGELYSRIQNTMWSYHNIRKQETDCLAPQITVYGDLLPVCDRSLLNLPTGIDLEIIDLPGLKSVQDRANLQIIQPQVQKSCSLVALDYGQVDEEHRQSLLQELKEVVTYLNGRTDSMIFVLNRVDMRGSDDLPLEQRIEQLKQEIKEVLSLDSPPNVIPFSARLLYNAQCAWGTRGGHLASQVDQATRLRRLEAMFKDCAGIIKEATRGDQELRLWFGKIEFDVENDKSIDDETMRKILRYALEWSGGQKLWETLRYRVQDSFPQLVIAPAFMKVLNQFDALVTKVNTIADVRKIEQLKELEELQEKLDKSRQQSQKQAESLRKDFFEDIEEIRKNLKENTVESRRRATQKIQKKGIQGFKSFTKAVDTVKQDITLKLMRPVREALKKKQGAYELEDKLKDIISPSLANQIGRAYDLMREKLINYKKDSGYFVFTAREGEQKAIQKLDHAEKAVRVFFEVMKRAIGQRTEFSLQTQAANFEKALQELAQSNIDELYQLISVQFPELQIDQAIFADFEQKLALTPLKITEDIVDFSAMIQAQELTKEVQVDQRTKRVTYTEGSCFKKEHKNTTVVEPIMGEVQYREIRIPNFDIMVKQWTEGIDNAESTLWDRLCDWMVAYLDQMNKKFDESIDEIFDFTNRTLKEQEKMAEQKTQETTQRWHEIETQQQALKLIRQQLREQL